MASASSRSGVRAEAGLSEAMFDMPTDVAFGGNGLVYVSDGYGNARVVVFDERGTYQGEWGRPGTGESEFDTAHSVAVGPDERVYVSDRGNARIQVFDAGGRFLRAWTHLGYTQGITFARNGECWLVSQTHSAAGRVFRVDPDSGEILAWLDSPGHMLDVAAWGDIFCASLMGNVIQWNAGHDVALVKLLGLVRGATASDVLGRLPPAEGMRGLVVSEVVDDACPGPGRRRIRRALAGRPSGLDRAGGSSTPPGG